MSEKEWAAESIFDVFGDGISRRILVLASHQPVSADTLADHLDVSKPTIYRRVNMLKQYDLLEERIRPNPENGSHCKQFETTLKRATFEITDGGLNIDLALNQNLVDQFEAFWTDLDDGSRQNRDYSPVDRPDRTPPGIDGSDG